MNDDDDTLASRTTSQLLLRFRKTTRPKESLWKQLPCWFFLGGNFQALQRRRSFICTEIDSRWLLDCDSAAVQPSSSSSCGAARCEFIKLLNSHSVSPGPKQKKIAFLMDKWWNTFGFLRLRKQKKTISFPAAVPPSGSALFFSFFFCSQSFIALGTKHKQIHK